MDYSTLGMCLIENGINYDVLITADRAYMEEFGEEFGALLAHEENGRTSLRRHLTNTYPNTQFGTARIILSGIVISTFPIGNTDEKTGLTQDYKLYPTAGAQKYTSYCAMPGETLDGIAAKFHVSVEKLMALNNMDINVYAGQKIRVPKP